VTPPVNRFDQLTNGVSMPESETPIDTTSRQPQHTDTCAVCPHPWTDHDRVAARFCTATVAGAYSRTCVCTPGS
jgi:hypothetical protein